MVISVRLYTCNCKWMHTSMFCNLLPWYKAVVLFRLNVMVYGRLLMHMILCCPVFHLHVCFTFITWHIVVRPTSSTLSWAPYAIKARHWKQKKSLVCRMSYQRGSAFLLSFKVQHSTSSLFHHRKCTRLRRAQKFWGSISTMFIPAQHFWTQSSGQWMYLDFLNAGCVCYEET